MKMDLEWHRECYRNARRTLQEDYVRLKRMQADYDREFSKLYNYRCQIERAEREGKDGFDADRYKPR